MSTNIWIFLSNTFEVNTRGSHVKGLSLATDHDSKLHAEISDPDILALYTPFHTVFQSYATICAQYDSVKGIRKGLTNSLETLMDEDLPLQLRVWEGIVRAVHPEDTPQEIMIFPNKRTPFLDGTYENRINAIASLIESLTANGGFAPLVTQVQSFHNLAVSTRDTQQQQEGLVGQKSDLRENQRLLVMQEMHGNFGMLLYKFRADVAQVERFFDLSLLRNTEQLTQIRQISNVVAAGGSNTEGELDEGAKVANITLLSGGPVEFGLSLDGATFVSTPITISIPDTVEFEFEEAVPAGTLILVKNLNLTEASGYQIEIFK